MKLDRDWRNKDIDFDEKENRTEALNQKVSMKMTRLLKKSSRTRPELTKALGVLSQLKNSFTYFADFLLVIGHLKLVVLSLPSHKYAFDLTLQLQLKGKSTYIFTLLQ